MNTLALGSTPELKHVSYATCEHLWSYLGKISLLARSILNAAARSCSIIAMAGSHFPDVVKDITNQLKLLSIVSLPFSVVDIHSAAGKIFAGFLAKDAEGSVLSALSFTIIAADIVDSVATFINAALVLSSANPIALFSAIGLPLGFTMVGLGIISRTIQIAKDSNLYRQAQEKSDLRELAKKMRVNVLGVTANLFMLTAFTIFSMGSVTPLPHVLKGFAYSIRLAALYQKEKIFNQ
jgi:hypothetical protein